MTDEKFIDYTGKTPEVSLIDFFEPKRLKFNENATINDVINVLNGIDILVHDESIYEKLKQLKGVTFEEQTKKGATQ